MTLASYLPQDRLRAIASNTSLPDRTSGSALFADISGFTALTEVLRTSLGSRKGAEELTRYLNKVYAALVSEVEMHGGSILGFAGDAITCWFNDVNDSSARAASCAFAMQEAMKAFTSISLPDKKTTALTLKVSVATGSARRFVVGDPDIHYIDALAGATVARTSMGDQLANKGEILVDEATVNTLGDAISIKEWRKYESGEKFAVVYKFEQQASIPNVQIVPTLEPKQLKGWINKTVYEREASGQGSFLTEFRPCAVLFINFSGIDYEADNAQSQLDTFIRQLQKITARYEGAILQLTIGDKGSYAYVNFGALIAHEDNTGRAAKAALEIRNRTELQVQMGITQGVMRVGAYGGKTRKAFGSLGDDANLAARLMSNAATGEILLTSRVYKTTTHEFLFEPRAPLTLKGKVEPVTVFALIGEQRQRAIRLQEPQYALPMVGRVEELNLIEEKLDRAVEGKGQVIAIIAEAGLGKSRLAAEVIRLARKKGIVGYGGACQSDAIHIPYQAWKSVWQAFFDIDPEQPLQKIMRNLEGEIEDRAPSRVDGIPLLNLVLDLNIPENEFTQHLEGKIRQSALHALLEDCLKAASKDGPLLIVIEDLHWVDALSHDLLEQTAKALANYPVCFMLVYRPPQMARLEAPRLEALAQFTKIELHELTQSEAESAIRAKLAQLYPGRSGALPGGLVKALMARAQGNPFYLEELLNFVRDRGLNPADIEKIELPDSLHTLILSRIDQLSEHEKTTLRVASIIGRLFHAEWLTGYYPELGAFPQVKAALDSLNKLDITPLDSPEPELAYLFKHIVTHEVTYESLPFATRARLHEKLAQYLEHEIAIGTAHEPSLLEMLVFHYGRSENQAKQVEYLRKSGEAAQKNFANDAALDHYGKLLPFLKDDHEKTQIHLKRGEVLELLGNWDDAETDYRAALETSHGDLRLKASAQFALGKLHRMRGNFDVAQEWVQQAKKINTELGDSAELARILNETGALHWRKGAYSQAREPLNQALELARAMQDKFRMGRVLNTLGLVMLNLGDPASARMLLEESLVLDREIKNKDGISESLNNLGVLEINQGKYSAAQALYEESLAIHHEIGEKAGMASSLTNLGLIAMTQGEYSSAQQLHKESLALFREMGDKWGMTYALLNLGSVTLMLKDHSESLAVFSESVKLCEELKNKTLLAYGLLGVGMAGLTEDLSEARKNILHSLRLRRETGEQLQQTSSLIGAAELVLHEGQPVFAAQLLGAVQSALKTLNMVMEPELTFFHERTLAKVKQALEDAAFQSTFDEGNQWSLEEAVKKALGEGQK